MNVALAIQSSIAQSGIPGIGPDRRSTAAPLGSLEKKLRSVKKEASLLWASLLIWHDHMEEAHQIAQGIETVQAAYLHGVIHRREPDFSNARYWFQRAGWEPLNAAIGTKLIEACDEGPWLQNNRWDPFGFVDACADGKESPKLAQIQAVELETAIELLLKQQLLK